jgi:hypothetical protein
MSTDRKPNAIEQRIAELRQEIAEIYARGVRDPQRQLCELDSLFDDDGQPVAEDEAPVTIEGHKALTWRDDVWGEAR